MVTTHWMGTADLLDANGVPVSEVFVDLWKEDDARGAAWGGKISRSLDPSAPLPAGHEELLLALEGQFAAHVQAAGAARVVPGTAVTELGVIGLDEPPF